MIDEAASCDRADEGPYRAPEGELVAPHRRGLHPAVAATSAMPFPFIGVALGFVTEPFLQMFDDIGKELPLLTQLITSAPTVASPVAGLLLGVTCYFALTSRHWPVALPFFFFLLAAWVGLVVIGLFLPLVGITQGI